MPVMMFCVYCIRCRATCDVIYIGSTQNFTAREQNHQRRFPCQDYDMEILCEYDSRQEMLDAERDLIEAFQPRENLMYTYHKPCRTESEYQRRKARRLIQGKGGGRGSR